MEELGRGGRQRLETRDGLRTLRKLRDSAPNFAALDLDVDLEDVGWLMESCGGLV